MKKLIRMAMIAIFAMTFQACSLDNEPQQDGNHRLLQTQNEQIYKFKLSLGGDYVDQSEEPLTRADEPKTYVGINVTRKQKTTGAKSEKYAYGVFTSRDDISIDLISGYTYDFETTVIVENTDKVYMDSKGLQEPFWTWQDDNYDENTSKHIYLKEQIGIFQYTNEIDKETERNTMCDLKYGRTRILKEDGFPKSTAYPRLHRYYATTTDVDPTNLPYGKITINLIYKCFGLQIIAERIPSGTYVTWEDVTDHRLNPDIFQLMFPENIQLGIDTESGMVNSWEDTYSLYKLTGDGSTTFKFRFTWNKGGGETETFTKDVTIHPNYRKVLKVSISGEPITTTSGNIELVEEENARTLTDDYQDISN